jgi:hypothetical protein
VTSDIVAQLTHHQGKWTIRDLRHENNLHRNGVRSNEFTIEPDDAIGFGRTTLIAESERSIPLRKYVERILGWTEQAASAVDSAARSIHLSSSFQSTLVLCGEYDVVPIAQALHRRTLGSGQPFILCDRRRREAAHETVRCPASRENAMDAFQAAREGSLCVRSRRLPSNFLSIVALAGDPGARVQLIVCAAHHHAESPLLATAAPIHVPPLRDRTDEVPRIIEEYGLEAATALGADEMCFTNTDRQWVADNAATTLPEIEKATMRLVALKTSANMSHAAARLGMAPVSLLKWILRRKALPTRPEL